MKHIRRIVRKKKRFDYRISSDGVSVSIQYMMKREFMLQDMDAIKAKYIDGRFKVALGVDPNMKTHTAVVRRHLDTGKEVNCLQSVVYNEFVYILKKSIEPLFIC